MNERELREIKRRFRPDRSNIPEVVGCFVSGGNIVASFRQSVLLSENDEGEKLLGIMKKALSGSLGTNLTDIEFSTKDVTESEKHKLLMSLRQSHLKDDGENRKLFSLIAESTELDGSYCILLANDVYDVYTKGSNEDEGSSSTVFSYIICAICPLKDTSEGLCFRESDSKLHTAPTVAMLASPALGFMFPSFDDRQTNIYHALMYTRDIARSNDSFTEAVFEKNAPMPPKVQKTSFSSAVSAALGDECTIEVVKSVARQIEELRCEHKESKDPEPFSVSIPEIKSMVASTGASDEKLTSLGEKLEDHFGKNAVLCPKNIAVTKGLDVSLPDISIKVKAEKQDLITTQIIGGRKFILIDASEGVTVNGMPISFGE